MKLGKINRNVRLFYAANSFYYGSFDVINAFLAILITTRVTNGRLDAVGFVIGYYMFLRALIVIPLSKYTLKKPDHQKIRFIMIGSLAYGALIATLGFMESLSGVFLIMTFVALLDALIYPIKWALFTKILDTGNEETEWSIEDSLSTVATACFSVLGGILSQVFGLAALFVTMGVMFAVSGTFFNFMTLRKVRSTNS